MGTSWLGRTRSVSAAPIFLVMFHSESELWLERKARTPAEGTALGTTIIAAAIVGQPGSNGGPAVHYILCELHAAGFDLDLVTAPLRDDPTGSLEHCLEQPVEEVPGDGCVRSGL